MKRWRALVALLLATPTAAACPCSGDAGGALSLVRADERFAVALAATARRALGRFDAWGNYRALSRDEGELGEELLLRVGLRAPERLEWLGELGYAAYRLHASGFAERQRGVGDALLRLRYTAAGEAMPHEALPLPSVTLSALVRVPLGAVASDTGTSFGAGGAPRGLGAWELGGGVELQRSLSPALEAWLGGEAAYRFADDALGRPRRLGPRFEAALGVRALPSPWLTTTLGLRLRSIGDVELGGRSLPGTSERLFSVIGGFAFFDRPSRFRSSVTLGYDPPLLSEGATAGASLGLSLAVGLR